MSETTGSLLDGQQTDPNAGLLGGNVDGGMNNTNVNNTDPKPGAGETKPWLEQVSADIRTNELLGGIENVNDLAGKHIELAGKMDQAIFKPGEGATEEDVKAYREKMDIPETSEGYEIKRPDLPKGLPYDEDLEKAALEVFHKAGMNREAAQMAMDFYNNMVIEAYKQMETDAEQARLDTKAQLTKDWGDELKPRVQKAERVLERFDSSSGDFKLRLEEKGLAYDPATYRFLNEIAQSVSEDTLMKPAEQGADANMDRTRDGTPMLKFKGMNDGVG
jgi:hypothetical protein